MTELDSTTTTRRSGWTMWLLWIAATCAGVVAMVLLLTAAWSLPERLVLLRIILVVAQLPGILLLSGAAQQCAMRFCLPGEKGWSGRTLLGALAGIAAGVLLAFLVGYLLTLADRLRVARLYGRVATNQGAPFAWMSIALLVGLVVSIAVAQWRVLRRHSRWAGWWPAIGFLGWAVGFLAAGKLMFPDLGFLEALAYYILDQASVLADDPGRARTIASGVVLGVLAGGITGAGLICILRAGPAVAQDVEPLAVNADETADHGTVDA